MCLVVKSDCKIEVAERPIPVIKVVSKESKILLGLIKFWHPFYINRLERFAYNRVLKSSVENLKEIPDSHNCVVRNIIEGFHAFLSSNNYLKDIHRYKNFEYIERYAVIPEGVEYCYGKFGEIVANKMIVFSSEEKFNRYMKKNNKE